MDTSWIAQVEHHVSFAFICAVCTVFLKNHRLIIKAKERLNSLWYDRCGLREDPYQPVENGTDPIVPPKPHWYHGD